MQLKLFIFISLLVSTFIFSPIVLASNSIAKNNLAEKQVLGSTEKIILLDKKLTLNAKLDTGAAMSSLSAIDIKTFKLKRKTWIKFIVYLPLTQTKVYFMQPVIKHVHILKRKEESYIESDLLKLKDTKPTTAYSIRPVIILKVCIGKQSKSIYVNLTDRTHFQYPMLLGMDALKKFNVLIDPSKHYLQEPICPYQ